jgi:hypothetical protein
MIVTWTFIFNPLCATQPKARKHKQITVGAEPGKQTNGRSGERGKSQMTSEEQMQGAN